MICDFTAIDTETTGLNPKLDRIIEIGAVKVRDGKITDRFESLINPGRKLDERIVQLTGITQEDLKIAPDIAEVLPSLLSFIGDDVLLGHKILFDFSFLKRAAVNQHLIFEKRGIDTLKLARRFLPELESKRLTSLCEYYGIAYDAHRAASDAVAATELYFKLSKQQKRQNKHILKDNGVLRKQGAVFSPVFFFAKKFYSGISTQAQYPGCG